ncbi:hypothetical protein EGW08_002414 [Elysia chlorotica]|uniref:G-patch domain-containing protein n=1 Tax=Elysia chlorotica TaxID=188477 RepID=A0A3S1BRJ0_ELYCH|nr:hypothetical protein EGW08_002414 [Elysia chlorotica]
MAMIDPAYRNLIQFVPEQPSHSENLAVKEVSAAASLSGQDVKSFYESVVGTPSSSVSTQPLSNKQDAYRRGKSAANSNISRKDKRRRNKAVLNIKIEPLCHNDAETEASSNFNMHANHVNSAKTVQSQPFDHLDRRQSKFLQAAQLGNCSKVCELLDQGVNLNCKDFYGWTALMCAAKEGHDQTVICLLDRGADSTLLNNEGLSASCLASLAGHFNLANSILSFSSSILATPQHDEEERLSSFYCCVCKDHFSKSEETAHSTSTVHLFNSGRKHKHPAYLLPETNRGFQMLLRTGWQVDEGLGPDGKGIKYPVKTVLKRDREGLGQQSEGKRAKITHFNPRDEAAVHSVMSKPTRNISARKSAQYALRSKEKRQRRKEIGFRFEFRDL